MKIEIDLNDILGDEEGVETLADSVRRQVIDKLTKTIKDGIQNQLDREVSRVIREGMEEAVKTQMPALIDDLMNATYKPVDTWGSRSEPTTFRAELIKAIHAQMTYKKEEYESRRNAFTTAVDSVIATKVAQFKAGFDSTVDAKFVAEAMAYATEKLAQRLNVKK
jgi:hypothetical protein